MANKILVVETSTFRDLPQIWPDAKKIDASKGTTPITEALRGLDGSTTLVVAPASLRGQSCFEAALNAGGGSVAVAYFANKEAFAAHAATIAIFGQATRTTGVKSFLEKGSTIYSEALFNASAVGSKLDPCFNFAHSKLNAKRAVDVWGGFHSLVFLGIRSLPEQGEKGTGERVDVQVGADANHFVFSVRFDLPGNQAESLRQSSFLEVTRSACDVFEIRALANANKIEILGIVFRNMETPHRIEVHTGQPDAALESNAEVKEYEFRGFGSLTGTAPEEKRVIKGGFKKKFSEQVTISAPQREGETVTRIAAETPKDDKKVVVSGGSSLGKAPETFTAATTEVAGKEKSNALLESKIQGLETTLKQREELITKLNKEIEEIKDPLKMGVISGIKDNQVEGLKGNIARLQAEVAEAAGREKELMAVVDKAIQLKDDAIKKLKDYETKLRQSQGGNNSKTQMLEKQLEEQKRQNKELSKKITQLMEQLGGKAA